MQRNTHNMKQHLAGDSRTLSQPHTHTHRCPPPHTAGLPLYPFTRTRAHGAGAKVRRSSAPAQKMVTSLRLPSLKALGCRPVGAGPSLGSAASANTRSWYRRPARLTPTRSLCSCTRRCTYDRRDSRDDRNAPLDTIWRAMEDRREASGSGRGEGGRLRVRKVGNTAAAGRWSGGTPPPTPRPAPRPPASRPPPPETCARSPHLLLVDLHERQHHLAGQLSGQPAPQRVVHVVQHSHGVREGQGHEGLVQLGRGDLTQGAQHVPAAGRQHTPQRAPQHTKGNAYKQAQHGTRTGTNDGHEHGHRQGCAMHAASPRVTKPPTWRVSSS
jgi:hypothetical protein